MEQVSAIKVILRDGSILDCELSYNAVSPYSLRLAGIELGRNEFVADDLFEAMVMLRRELEPKGALLLCAGARPEVYPSPMSRIGSGGIRAYVTKLGHQTSRECMVDIFDYATPESVGTVEQQIAHHGRWVCSLQEKPIEITPMPGEVEEAKKFPNGYVYRISGRADPAEGIPPEAIVGAWPVGPTGEIIGGFIPNPKHDPARWPFKV